MDSRTAIRTIGRRAWPLLVLLAVLGIGFQGLIRHPTWWIVDDERPSLDRTRPPGDRSLGNDFTRYHLPRFLWMVATHQESGAWPTWDPSGFGGRPLVGNPQAGWFYPPAWIARYLGDPASLGWLTVAHLLLAGLGGYRLARASATSQPGSTLSGAAYMLSPGVIAHVAEGHYPHIWAIAWAPWCFLAARRAGQGRAWGWFALPIFLSLSLITGHPQEGMNLFVALGLLALIAILSAWRRGDKRGAKKHIQLTGWSGLLVLGLTTAEWLTIACVMPHAARPASTAGAATQYDWEPVQLLQVLSPTALGDAPHYQGPGTFWEALLGFGFATAFLAAVGARFGRPRGWIRSWIGLAIVSAWYAAGPKLGFYTIINAIVPGMSMFRVPGRALLLTAMAVAMLAGQGWDVLNHGRWPSPAWRVWRRVMILGIALVVMLGLIAYVAPVRGSFWLGCARLLADPIFGLAALACLVSPTLADRWPGKRPLFLRFLLTMALMELVLLTHRLIPVSPPGRFLGSDPVRQAIRDHAPVGPFRIRARDAFYTDLDAARDRIEKSNIMDVFQLQHTRFLHEPLHTLFSYRKERSDSTLVSAVLDRLGVAMLVSNRPEPVPGCKVIAEGRRGDQPFQVFHNPDFLPRAYVAPQVKTSNQDRSKTVSVLVQTDPRSTVLLDSDPLAGLRGSRQSFQTASIERNRPDQIRLEVHVRAPGILVLTEAWMPGWSATRNGEPIQIHRADLAWQAVALPSPGTFRVEFSYHPPGLCTGLCISLLVLAGLAIYFAARSRVRFNARTA